jgi:hypothetical protein
MVVELTMAVLFSSTSRDDAQTYQASIATQWPLAEVRPNGDAWEVHDLPEGYFAGAVFDAIVDRVIEKLTQQQGG